jgi:hypothetical protein
MEERNVNLWWNALKDIAKFCKWYERSERLYMHKISHMEKVIPTFECEPLVFSLEPKTSYEEEDKGDTSSVGPLGTRTTNEEPRDLKGGKESLNREAIGKTCIKTDSRTNKICCAGY